MTKSLSSWSGMRKYLEQEMLSPCLHDRIRYGCTEYAGMDGCHIFEVFVDGKPVKRFSLETVNTYFIENGYKPESACTGVSGYWDGFQRLLSGSPPEKRTEYTEGEFCDALKTYRSQPISESLFSENPIVRMFAVLDRRVGKRTLDKLKDGISEQPDWLRFFYLLRIEADTDLS